MRIEDHWRTRIGQMWHLKDKGDSFVIVDTKVHENTCTVVHKVLYSRSGEKLTMIEHGGSEKEKSWSLDQDDRLTRMF